MPCYYFYGNFNEERYKHDSKKQMKLPPLIEFNSLKTKDVFSIAKVEWWLLKYKDLYSVLKSFWSCPNDGCYHETMQYCGCENRHDEYLFLELYKALDDFSTYHRREGYAQQELLLYKSIMNDEAQVKQWVMSNEKVGADECFMFLIQHHDYNANPVHLKVSDKSLLGYDVFVDRSDFKNLMDYMEIFSDLFWGKEVYPESEILLGLEKLLNENRPDTLIDFDGS